MITLNDQYNALMAGKYDESKAMAYQLHEDQPWDNDIAFNTGWFKLSDNEIKEGYSLLDRGREKGPNGYVWGDSEMHFNTPVWRGAPNKTVMLKLERGIGDQFHQVRYARELKAKGCTTVVSCSPSLADVICHADGVDVVVQHEAAAGVLHNFHLPAMSSPMHMDEGCIRGEAYISRPPSVIVPGRVGLCWQGNVSYEHQTKRKFPPELLFSAIKGRATEFINLQKDEGIEHKPDWVQMVDLSSWVATASAMASCEYIITSCTSIAHLSGAMGIPTFIIIPIVPYYLWSLPGVKTPYYDSVTLLRQTSVDNWLAPFQELAGYLERRNAA